MRNRTLMAATLRIGESLHLDAVLREVADRVHALKGDAQATGSAVTRLRRKRGEDGRNPRYVLGEHGTGYRMPELDSR